MRGSVAACASERRHGPCLLQLDGGWRRSLGVHRHVLWVLQG